MQNQKVSLDRIVSDARATLSQNWDEHLEDLRKLVRIPSVSFPGFDPEQLEKSAQATANLLKSSGFENVEIMRPKGPPPYVYGDWLKAGPNAPTLLLYAHHDVQPPGREHLWKSPPFEPTLREGPGGMRLYARGSADDKAGILVHAAAVSTCLKTFGKLPVNVKVIIEGEEEIGSEYLFPFLKQYRDKLDADVLLLTDTANYDCGVPSLTIALRGLVVLQVEVRGLNNSVHSGMWGGPVPDPAVGLMKALSSLTDDKGHISVPEIVAQIPSIDSEEEAALKSIPFEEKNFRTQAGLRPGVSLQRQGPATIAQLWKYPSFSINAVEASSRKQAGNIINDVVWARVGLRLPPGMDSAIVAKDLAKAIQRAIPWGLEAKVEQEVASSGWATAPYGKHRVTFDLAKEALELGYGSKPVLVGCGGSIPFVAPFSDALGDVPALLIGVEDPYTNAHGENESLLVEDLKSGVISSVALYHLLALNRK